MPGKAVFRVPVATRTRVVRIIGKPDLQGVEVENLDTGRAAPSTATPWSSPATGSPTTNWPAAPASTSIPAPKDPVVDTALRTSQQGVFAAGNVLHPVDTADIAALDGTFVADRVQAHLCKGTAAARPHGDPDPSRRPVPMGVARACCAPTIPPRRASGCCCGATS